MLFRLKTFALLRYFKASAKNKEISPLLSPIHSSSSPQPPPHPHYHRHHTRPFPSPTPTTILTHSPLHHAHPHSLPATSPTKQEGEKIRWLKKTRTKNTEAIQQYFEKKYVRRRESFLETVAQLCG